MLLINIFRIAGTMSNVTITATHAQYELFMGVLGENLSSEPSMLVVNDAIEITADMLSSLPADEGALPAVKDSERESIGKWVSLELTLTLDNVSLTLFRDSVLLGMAPAPLARFDFIDSNLSFTTFTDGTPRDGGSATTIYSKKIIAYDTRRSDSSKPNQFPHVLSPAHFSTAGTTGGVEPQLQITYRSSPDAAIVHVILNKACVFMALDWLKSVKEFLFTRAPNQLCAQPAREPSVPRGRERAFQLTLSITQPEFVLCLDNTRPDTDAIVLKFCALLDYKSEPTAKSGSSNRDTLFLDLQVSY